jgi:heme exporter protein B
MSAPRRAPPPPTRSWRHFTLLVGQGLRAELADFERILSPVLFAVTLLILFAFAMGEVDDPLKARVYLAETFLTAFFALQVSFSRLFEPDRQDRVFDVLRTYPVSHTAWFLAKYVLVMALGLATLAPTLVFGAFLHQTARVPLFSWVVCGIAALALAGLAALGVLLSALTLKANSRQILYPLLYFPLTTPVLLAAVQSSLTYLQTHRLDGAVQSWLGLLLAFDAIYFTLGVLLFTELVDES